MIPIHMMSRDLNPTYGNHLFTYGILRDPAIMRSVIDSLPASVAATLRDHRALEVVNANYPGLVEAGGAATQGTLYLNLSEDALERLDAFEGAMYERVPVTVVGASGDVFKATVYRFRTAYRHLLRDSDWQFERFVASGLMGNALSISLNPWAEAGAGEEIVRLLDTYARDPMGGGKPLTHEARANLVAELRRRPWITVWLARFEGVAVGLMIALEGFSTFAARPLLNIHDVAVAPEFRGRGIGKALFREAERVARARGYAKITLEVLEGNERAQQLYRGLGFAPYTLDHDTGPAQFWQKLL